MAVLSIVFDLENETLYFDGSVTATTSATGQISWDVSYGSNIENADIVANLVDNLGAVTLSGGADLDPLTDDLELFGTNDTLRLFFSSLSASTSYTITGNPNIVASYSLIDAGIKAQVALFAQSNTALVGTVGSDLGTVQMITAVPEPLTYASLLGLGALIFVVSRKRHGIGR